MRLNNSPTRAMHCWAIVLTVLSGQARAAEPQVVDLGSSLQEWQDQSEYRCVQEQPGKNVCRLVDASGLAVQEMPLRGMDLYFADQRLERICRVIDEAEFPRLRQRLRAQRDDATDQSELLKAGMGGSFKNEIWVWNDPGVITMLEQFHERITTSALCILGSGAFEQLMRARAKHRVRGVRDL